MMVDQSIYRTEEIVRDYFQRFPNSSIFRLCVAPGEAYIAPTDNLIHDGSTARQ